MAARRRYLVLDAFAARAPEHDWVQPGQCYEGEEVSAILPCATAWVRLTHPTQSDTTGLVLKRLLLELQAEDTNAWP